jgi:hypothetical protein
MVLSRALLEIVALHSSGTRTRDPLLITDTVEQTSLVARVKVSEEVPAKCRCVWYIGNSPDSTLMIQSSSFSKQIASVGFTAPALPQDLVAWPVSVIATVDEVNASAEAKVLVHRGMEFVRHPGEDVILKPICTLAGMIRHSGQKVKVKTERIATLTDTSSRSIELNPSLGTVFTVATLSLAGSFKQSKEKVVEHRLAEVTEDEITVPEGKVGAIFKMEYPVKLKFTRIIYGPQGKRHQSLEPVACRLSVFAWDLVYAERVEDLESTARDHAESTKRARLAEFLEGGNE